MYTPYDAAEIALEPGEPYSKEYFRILNNFHLYFRVGNQPNDPEKSGLSSEGQYRTMSRFMERLDMKHDDFFSDTEDKDRMKSRERHSARWFRQSDAEFFAEIDRTIVELGMKVEDVARVINEFSYGSESFIQKEKSAKKLFHLLAPIYQALRLKGYSAFELTS